jgi:hypothetical protein
MSNNDISQLVSLPSLISAYANNHDHEKIESSFNIQVQVDNQYCPQGQQNTPNSAGIQHVSSQTRSRPREIGGARGSTASARSPTAG